MRPLEFVIGDHIFLKVFSYKGRMWFGKKGKLSPHFVGPFKILERVGPLAYYLALPPKYAALGKVFHVSMLKKYHHDPFHIILHSKTLVRSNMAYVEYPPDYQSNEESSIQQEDSYGQGAVAVSHYEGGHVGNRKRNAGQVSRDILKTFQFRELNF